MKFLRIRVSPSYEESKGWGIVTGVCIPSWSDEVHFIVQLASGGTDYIPIHDPNLIYEWGILPYDCFI